MCILHHLRALTLGMLVRWLPPYRQSSKPEMLSSSKNLALRHQLGILHRSVKKPKLTPFDWLLWAWLCGVWADWRSALIVVKPETVIAWHRKGFRLFWTWKVRHGQPGRPSVLKDVRDLIRLMSRANPTMLVRENLSKAISVQPAALSLRWYTQPRLRKGSK